MKFIGVVNIALYYTVLTLPLVSVRGQGVIFQHTGATDPTTEGFNYVTSGPGTKATGAVTGDAGENAWFTSVSDRATAWYSRPLSSAETTTIANSAWNLSLKTRVLTGAASTFGNSFVNFYTEQGRYYLNFGKTSDGKTFVRVGGGSLSPIYTLPVPDSVYHIYQLRSSGTGGLAELWVDGFLRISDISPLQEFAKRVEWGEGQAGPSRSHWSEVSLHAVPEPSTCALFLCGGGLLAFRLARERKLTKSPPPE